MIIVPWTSLSTDALYGVIDAYVLREGTDYGARSYTLEEKRQAVLEQLRTGAARVVFDPQTETTDIVLTDRR